MRSPLLLVLVLALALSGCLNGSTLNQQSAGGLPTAVTHAVAPVSMLQNVTAPANLTKPVFKLLGTVGKGGPIYGAGEPSIRAAMDGNVYLSFPGCDRGTNPVFFHVSGPSCADGPVYRSGDQGATWMRLNDANTGKLSPNGPSANGDASIAVDSNGTVYASDLGNGIQVWSSSDHGGNWTFLGNLAADNTSVDRQWLGAADPGHLVVMWKGGANFDRAVVRTTFDGGRTWTHPMYLGTNVYTTGAPRFSTNGTDVYIPYVSCLANCTVNFSTPVNGSLNPTFAIFVLRSQDGGRTWQNLDTGARFSSPSTSISQPAPIFPVLAVTQSGRVAVAWSHLLADPTGTVETGAAISLVTSDDHGTTWSTPATVSTEQSAIMPWISGGAAGRVVLTYFASPTAYQHAFMGPWSVRAAVVATNGTVVRSTVAPNVHLDGICTSGSACPIVDRDLLDFFQNTILPDGHIMVVYPTDPIQGGRYIDINTAIQTGGSPMFVPATPASSS